MKRLLVIFVGALTGFLFLFGVQSCSTAYAQPVNGCPNPNVTCNGIKSTTGTFSGTITAGAPAATCAVTLANNTSRICDDGTANAHLAFDGAHGVVTGTAVPYIDTQGYFQSDATNGNDGIKFTNEAEIQWPDTKIAEVGTTITMTGAVTATGVLTVNNDINLTSTTTGLHNNAGLLQLKAAAGQMYMAVGSAGTGDNAFQGGTLNAGFFTTAVGNVGVSGPDDLQTYTVTANTLTNGSRGLRITTWGTCANNVNAKTFTLNFGSQVILTHACTVSVASQWRIVSHVARTGTSTQDWESNYFGNSGAANAFEYDPEIGTATQTETATIVVKMQSTTSTTNNDIVQEGMLIEYL